MKEVGRTSCPYILLPDNWEEYFEKQLGRSTRRHMRAALRKMESSTDLEITGVTKTEWGKFVDALHALWQARFGKPPDRVCENNHHVLRQCFEAERLWLSVLWKGGRPVGSLACFLDPERKAVLAFRTAFDTEYSEVRPGMLLFGESIRRSVESGFQLYDFLRGDEEYKFRLGGIERFSKRITITKRNLTTRMRAFVCMSL